MGERYERSMAFAAKSPSSRVTRSKKTEIHRRRDPTPGRRLRQDQDPDEADLLRAIINPSHCSYDQSDDSQTLAGASSPSNANSSYLEDLRLQIAENAERKRIEEQEELREDVKIREERAKFRKGGGGSPIRTRDGQVVTRRRPMSTVTGESSSLSSMPISMLKEHRGDSSPTSVHPEDQGAEDQCCEMEGECTGCKELRNQVAVMAIEMAALQSQMGYALSMFQSEKERNNELSQLMFENQSRGSPCK